jgi:hypothetical protein
MKSYPCSDLPEFAWLEQHPQLKSEILQRFEGEDAQLREATRLVKLHVFKRIPYRGSSARFIAGLQMQGVDADALARALAQAWLLGSDEFTVPRKSWIAELNSTWMRLLVSLAMALLILVTGMRVLRHVNRELDLYLLAIPPLIAIIGFALTALIFVVWSRVLKLFFGQGGNKERAQ